MSDIIKSSEVNYASKPVLYGKYQWHKITPNETNGTITIDNSGGQTLTWNFPADKVFNPAKSYIKIPYAVDAATAASYQYMPADCHPWWRIVDWSPTSGIPLMHVEDYDHYSKLVMRPSVHYEDFKTYDDIGGFSRSNSLVSQNKRPDGSNSSINWEEPKFWSVSGLAAALSGTLYIPLSRFIDTALAVDKDMFMGQISTLQFTFKPTTQFLFVGTDQYNPTVGCAAIANARTFVISNALLYLAIEKDEVIINTLKAEFALGKHEFVIPYVKKVNKTSYTAQTNNGVIVRLYPKDGFKIAKIYQGIFSSEYTLTAGTISNFLSTVLPAYGAGNTMYTSWDSQRRQENDLVLGTDDYLLMRDQFVGSCYLSNGAFQNAWVFIENFSEDSPKSEEDMPLSNRWVGADLSTERVWEFNLTWAGNQTVNLYTYPISLKKFRASPAGVEVFP